MYSVVETTNINGRKEVASVLSSWIVADIVFWPDNYHKAIKKKINVDFTWQQYQCRILKGNIEKYLDARKAEKHYEVWTNSESEGLYLKKPKTNFKTSFTEEFDLNIINNELPELLDFSNNEVHNTVTVNPNEIKELDNDGICNNIPPSVEISAPNQAKDIISNQNKIMELHSNCKFNETRTLAELSTIKVTEDMRTNVTANQNKIIELNNDGKSSELPPLVEFSARQNAEDMIIKAVKNNDPVDESCQNCSHLIKLVKKQKKSESSSIKHMLQILTNKMEVLQDSTNKLQKKIKRVEEQQNQMPECLTGLVCSINKTKTTAIVKDNQFFYPVVPFQTVEQLKLFEGQLINQHFMDQMVVRLFKFKAPSLNRTIKYIFEHLFDPHLLRKYSWSGQAGLEKKVTKLIFAEHSLLLNLMELVVNYMARDQQISQVEIKKAVQEYLKRSAVNKLLKNKE